MYTITAQKRDPSAKAKQLRRSGVVPCVIYGGGLEESLSVQLDQATARQLKRTKRNGSKVNIKVEDKTFSTLIKDLEYNMVNDQIIHISFQELDPNKKVSSVADVILINKDKVAGVLEQIQLQVPHAALPEYLLDTVVVDLEKLAIGSTLTIADIPEFNSDKIELQADPENIVVRISEKKRMGAAPAEEE